MVATTLSSSHAPTITSRKLRSRATEPIRSGGIDATQRHDRRVGGRVDALQRDEQRTPGLPAAREHLDPVDDEPHPQQRDEDAAG